MAKFEYKTTPTLTEKAPPGIWHILTNEAAERFAYYGMSFILYTFMTEYLLGSGGEKMLMAETDAKSLYHIFKAANYATPIIGALLSDIWLGKFKTIVWFSILYCIGFIMLVVDQTRVGLFSGLLLIALASGIIKPCVSANVGDQFGKMNKHLMTKIYNWFYFAINLGAYVGPLLTPLLLYSERFGPKWAFGLTGMMMVFATVVFWIGRRRYVHAPPAGIGFVKECFSKDGVMTILKLAGLYVFIAMFWTLFEQTGSSWIEQAKKLNLHFAGVTWKADQIPASQALFVMIMIPIFSYAVYPAMNKIFKLTALRKIGIGMFLTAVTFIIPFWLEKQIAAGQTPSVGWQFLGNILLTAAELFVSVTSLEFMYSQAPVQMKSFIMSIYLLAISLGNVYAALFNQFVKGTKWQFGPSYFLMLIYMMLGATVVFIIGSLFYHEKTHMQDEETQPTESQ